MRTSLRSSVVGVQEPRFRVVPAEFDEALSRERHEELLFVSFKAGVEEDEWQEIATRDLTLTRADGKWASFEAFVAANRQQGKGTIIEDRQLAGLFMWDEPLQVYTAHEFKTAQEMFLRIRNRIESAPSLDRLVQRIRTADGEEAIETKNGCRLKFMARSTGSGRGFTGTTVYLDEAFKLKHRVMAALLPTMAAMSVEGNPQLIYASSAGMAESDVQGDVRERALGPNPGRLTYLEWSVPRFDELAASERARYESEAEYLDDPEVHRRANPAYNIRLSPEFVQTERDAMGDEEFARERLGIWARLGGETVFPGSSWADLADPGSEPGEKLVFAVDVSPKRDSVSIALVSFRDDGRVHGEIVENREGTSWVGSRLRELKDRWNPAAIVAIAGSQAESLIPTWKRDGVRVKLLRFREYIEACGIFYDMVIEGRFRHLGDAEVLDPAVDGAKQQWTADNTAWYWSRKRSDVDISPLVALTVAVAGLEKKTGKRSSVGHGKALVL